MQPRTHLACVFRSHSNDVHRQAERAHGPASDQPQHQGEQHPPGADKLELADLQVEHGAGALKIPLRSLQVLVKKQPTGKTENGADC